MMRIRFIVVGKPTREYATLIHEYEQRLPKYCTFEVFEVKDDDGITTKLKGTIVALDSHGKNYTSESLAEWVKGQTEITFVIGGDVGLSDELKRKSNLMISFGAITLPHQLARLVLTEQIYRAFTILKGEKYHK